MFASRFAYCNQALVFKSHVSMLRYRLTDCHSETLGEADDRMVYAGLLPSRASPAPRLSSGVRE